MSWSKTGWGGDDNGWMTPAPSAATTTWNPSDKNANISLSGGNLVASTSTTSFKGVRAIASASSGKKYHEITATAYPSGTTQTLHGLANSTHSLSAKIGDDTNSIGWRGDGTVRTNTSNLTAVGAWAQGDVIGIAVDIGAALVWFRKNGGNWNNSGTANPATGVGGIALSVTGSIFPCSDVAFAGESCTANFGATAYANAAPSGFGNW